MVSKFRNLTTGFFMVSNKIFEMDTPLSPYAVTLYCYLRKLGDTSYQAFPSYKNIMYKCGIKARATVKKTIDELVSRGLLHVENRIKDGKKELSSNLYTVFPEPSPEAGYIRLLQKQGSSSNELPLVHDVNYPSSSNELPLVHNVNYPSSPDELELYSLNNTQFNNTQLSVCGVATQNPPPTSEKLQRCLDEKAPHKDQIKLGEAIVTEEPKTKNHVQGENQIDKLYSKAIADEPQAVREKKPYGEYGTVLLSDKEHEALVVKYGPVKVEDYIERMDLHCASRKPYKNCSAELKKWITKDDRIAEEQAAKAAVASPSAATPKPNRFINFNQREKDYDKIRKLEDEYLDRVLFGEDGQPDEVEYREDAG
jgi:hypothetical protein